MAGGREVNRSGDPADGLPGDNLLSLLSPRGTLLSLHGLPPFASTACQLSSRFDAALWLGSDEGGGESALKPRGLPTTLPTSRGAESAARRRRRKNGRRREWHFLLCSALHEVIPKSGARGASRGAPARVVECGASSLPGWAPAACSRRSFEMFRFGEAFRIARRSPEKTLGERRDARVSAHDHERKRIGGRRKEGGWV